MTALYIDTPSNSRFIGHRGHIVMLPAGWILLEIVNKKIPILALCGQVLEPIPDPNLDTCTMCVEISKAIHNQWCDVPEECCAVSDEEGPQRPPYTERVHDQWGLRYDARKFILMTRACDEDGLDWQENEQPWSDVAVFSSKRQADRAIDALRSRHGL